MSDWSSDVCASDLPAVKIISGAMFDHHAAVAHHNLEALFVQFLRGPSAAHAGADDDRIELVCHVLILEYRSGAEAAECAEAGGDVGQIGRGRLVVLDIEMLDAGDGVEREDVGEID